jgi:outer membrane protein TolC
MTKLAWLLLPAALLAQAPGVPSSGPQLGLPGGGNLADAYRAPRVAPVRLENSGRWDTLLRGGKLYLSLKDAIALALENNLDLELVRYAPRIAETDELRAAAGQSLRGVPLSVREGPLGLGTPAVGANGALGGGDTPALNALVGPGVQTDLSILGSLPLSTGAAVPSLDPVMTGGIGWNHQSDPQNSALLPNLRSLNSSSAWSHVGLQQGFLSGGQLEFGWDNQQQRVNSPLLNYNPFTRASLGLTFTQPLLRGFGLGVNNRYIRIARNNRQVSDYVFRQQAIATVSAVVRLYWDLVSLDQDTEVRRQAQASAAQLVADTRNQVQAGTAAPIDQVRAEAELARRRRDVAVSESLVRQQEEVIKDFLSRSRLDSVIATARIVPTDAPAVPEHDPVEPLDDMVAGALNKRPDVAQARLQVANSEISLSGSKSALRPALDLVATAQNNGLAGDAIAGAPLAANPLLGPGAADPLLIGGFGGANSQLFGRNFPDYGVGLRLSIPLRNRAARADVIRDQLTVRQQQLRLQQFEKQVRLEVTNALIAVQQARESYNATRQERILGEQALAAEVDKMEVGATTTFYVIQSQRDLAAARSAEVSALASYVKARAALQRAVGTILSDYDIEIDEARQGAVRRQN